MRMGILVGMATTLSVLAGCAATPDYQPILTKDEYMTAVVGRSVTLGSGSTTTHLDGTMTGNVQGGKIIGEWSWEDGKFCREGLIGAQKLERDCQEMEVAGDKLRITRGNGTQEIFVLK